MIDPNTVVVPIDHGWANMKTETKALLMIITGKWRLRQIKRIKEKELNN